MSWWVGKDRDAFSRAVAERLQKRPVRPDPPTATRTTVVEERGFVERVTTVVEAVSVPALEPIVVEVVPEPAIVSPPQPSPAERRHQRLLRNIRTMVERSPEAQDDPRLGEAAVVMFGGWLLRCRAEPIRRWTGYPRTFVRRTVANLHRAGIWDYHDCLHCKWMDAFVNPRATKREQAEADIAFWLDAMVAEGQLFRETRNGEFFYGLSEWKRQ